MRTPSEQPSFLQERVLVFVLRFSAVVLVAAFPMILLPVDWMAAVHRALGLGQFPASPLVDYLTRSISFLYGYHGILLFIAASDVRRYRPIIVYAVIMGLTFGVVMIAVDLHAGMPLRWIVCEGPSVIVTSVIVGLLLRAVPRDGCARS